MAINYSPVLRNPFTDLTSTILVQQHYGRCAWFEMRFMECLEAYGADQSMRRCKLFAEDYGECLSQYKQKSRYVAMRAERTRQAKENKTEVYLPPPPKDAY